MPTIDKKNINDSIQKAKKGSNLSYFAKNESYFWISSQSYGYHRYFWTKKGAFHNTKSSFGRKRKNRIMFPFNYKNDLFSIHKNEIIRNKKNENKPLTGVKLITRYLDILNFNIKKIKFKETIESYLIEFIYQENYFLIEFFYDNDIVLLIRNNESKSRQAWDFTINHIVELLQVLQQNISEDRHE